MNPLVITAIGALIDRIIKSKKSTAAGAVVATGAAFQTETMVTMPQAASLEEYAINAVLWIIAGGLFWHSNRDQVNTTK